LTTAGRMMLVLLMAKVDQLISEMQTCELGCMRGIEKQGEL
jgi:hypothetical protein